MKAIAYNIRPQEKEHLVKVNAKRHELTFISNEFNEDTLVYCFEKEVLILNSLDVLNQRLLGKLKDLGVKQIICSSDIILSNTLVQWATAYDIHIRGIKHTDNMEEKAQNIINQLTSSLGIDELIEKYNVAAPRYTSYPTVPYWDTDSWNKQRWIEKVKITHAESPTEGISIYIHLPFCESLCTYCGCTTRITKNHQVELPYIQDVIKEWQLYKKHLGENITIGDIHLGGGTPTFFAPENLELLISSILSDSTISAHAEFSFEAHPANTTEEHLSVLYSLGFRRLSLGIQDFDPLVQFIINRKQSEEEILWVMNKARQIGYTSINFDLIYGLPKQSIDTIRDTINKVIDLKPDRISFYSYAHVPWLKPGQRHYSEKDLPKDEEKLELYKSGRDMILAANYEDVGMDHFALRSDALFIASERGMLHRNFMGYTDRKSPLMIGLGVSAISDSWNAFAQNVKRVEDYHLLLSKNELPLIKGHIHVAEDLIIRRHILDIMCKGRAKWKHGDPLIKTLLKNILPLQEDGLIKLSETGLVVTELGKSFIRNICMAFDRKLAICQSDKEIFSKAI